MAELSLVDDITSLWTLYRARVARSKGATKEARAKLDRVLAFGSGATHYPLALAFDATIMFEEGDKLAQARSRLQECLDFIDGDDGEDAKFISAFCQAWLTLSDEQMGYSEIEIACLRANEARLTASRFAKLLLVYLPIDVLRRTFGDRKSLSDRLRAIGGGNRVSNVAVALDF